MAHLAFLLSLMLSSLSLPASQPRIGGDARDLCIKDVDFALDTLEKKCGHFFELKGIDWNAVGREFRASAKTVKDEREHYGLLIRLLARLRDGHCEVRPVGKGASIRPPDELFPQLASAGFTLCRSGGKLYLKSVFGPAAKQGLAPGMEVAKVGKLSAADWIAQREEEMRDVTSYSTEQQAFYSACNWGPMLARGTKLEIEASGAKGKKLTKSLDCGVSDVPLVGPAFPPKKLEGSPPIVWGLTKQGFGYLWLSKCPQDLPARIDPALEELADAPGLIVDFRGNAGGAFDHEDFLGRFLPKGSTLSGGKGYESTGAHPYGGPVVVLIDAGVRSAGESAAGIFKEDGRGWLIGESPTAGMSSSKETIELPSGLFALYVAVASNKGRFNGGKGIEGIGVPPSEVVEYEPEDLAQGIDTLLRVAEERLMKFPQDKVRYDPAKAGWKAKK
jgi:carboxyl-terminal processing protease